MKRTEAPSPRVIRLQTFSLLTGILVATFGFAVLLASILNLANLSTLKANSALAFLLSGISLLLLAKQSSHRLTLVLAVLVTVIGLATLLEYSLNADLHIDELFGRSGTVAGTNAHPGRITPIGATIIALVGISLTSHVFPKTIALGQGVAMSALLLGFVPLVGYAYDVEVLYSFGGHSSIAFPKAVCFVILSLGILAVRADEGFMREVLGESVGGIMAQRLLPAALILPLLIGWLRLEGQRRGYYNTETGTALLVLAYVIVFFLLIIFNARLLRKTEVERAVSRAEAARLSIEVQKHLSERNAAHIKVRQSQEQLIELVDSASDAIISIDEDDAVTLFNPAAQKMFGLSELMALGTPVRHFIPISQIDLAPTSNSSDNAKAQLISTIDGRGRKIQIEASVSKTISSGAKTFILRDVTERRKADQVAKESEERLHTVIESLTEGLVIADLDGQLLHWNQSALRMHGFENLEEVLLKVADFQKLFELSTPDGRVLDLAEWPLPRIMAGETLNDYEVCVRSKDHHWERVFSYGGTIVKEPNGKPLAFVTVTDITERNRYEESLREQARMLDLAPVMICDLDGRILFWNEGARQMFRWSADEALDKLSDTLLHTQFPRPVEEIKACVLSRGHWEGELVHFRKDGRRLVVASQWVLHCDQSGKPKAVLEINNDITERKLAEEEIKRLNEELERRVNERTAQLQAANNELEAFSYSVSHDLRAPLRHINGFSQALLEDYEDKLDGIGKGYLNEVREASQEMAHLIDDVLQLARVTRSEMHREPVNLSELAKGVLAELQKIDRERAVDINIQSDLAVQCDRRLMRIVLANLLGNAWKFTAQRPRAEVTFGHAKENGEKIYFVRDNGAGFDMAFASKLFRAFQRLHNRTEFEGTGIGLATVQRIINRHGGRVWAESKPNEGATFYFALPNSRETGDEAESDFSR